MKSIIRECTSDDTHKLHELSCKTFSETFSFANTPTNMKAYLEQAFDTDKLRNELSNSSSLFYFLYADEELAGYMKLNECAAQTDNNDPKSIEIERIYVAEEFKGKGFGSTLLNKAFDIARARNKSYIWLGVWEKNYKAISFYKKNGLYVVGDHPFFVGEDEQIDLVMRKDLKIEE